jgi:hypothetical protein
MTAPNEAPVGDRSVLDCLNLLVVRPVASTYVALQGACWCDERGFVRPRLGVRLRPRRRVAAFLEGSRARKAATALSFAAQGLLDRRRGRSLWKCRRHAAALDEEAVEASRAFSRAIRSSGSAGVDLATPGDCERIGA